MIAVVEVLKVVSGEPSPKFHLNCGLRPPVEAAVKVMAVFTGAGAPLSGCKASSVFTFQVKLVETAGFLPSETETTVVEVPAAVGEPVMKPLFVVILSPGGNPVAL